MIEEVYLMPTVSVAAVAAGQRFPCFLCPRTPQSVNDNSPANPPF